MTEEFDDLLTAATAFRVLGERFSPPVAGHLRTRGIRDVDDVTSEVFLSVFSGLDPNASTAPPGQEKPRNSPTPHGAARFAERAGDRPRRITGRDPAAVRDWRFFRGPCDARGLSDRM